MMSDFLHYSDGGLEVKNTFGSKRTGMDLMPRHTRQGSINRRLVWKAHHRLTNYLIALQSDYLDRVPQIVRCFFSHTLSKDDWRKKAQPKEGSTMTSFTELYASGYKKLSSWVVFSDERYLEPT